MRMKLPSAKQIHEWDQYTIANEPVSSVQLMERAASACVQWIVEHLQQVHRFVVYCGTGNNGGDGLAIARMLKQKGKFVQAYVLVGGQASEDFLANKKSAISAGVPLIEIKGPTQLPVVDKDTTIIDALFGSGLNRPLDGLAARLVDDINATGLPVISIDLPSGLFADQSSAGGRVVKAGTTLSFQTPKLAFLMPENADRLGSTVILDIGLHHKFLSDLNTRFEWLEAAMIRQWMEPRNAFAHKGTYGHAALLAGSEGMMGAAILSARACLRSGAGKLTCYVPARGGDIMQVAVPEAVLHIDTEEKRISKFQGRRGFQSVGIGPGIGNFKEHISLLEDVMKAGLPMVMDADALNTMANSPGLIGDLPANTILTPHPKEFERLFGAVENDFDRVDLAMRKAAEHKIIIVLKGHHTLIALPGGRGFFNSTGNAGMAKAGSGDVLTGMLTGLLARGYAPEKAATIGVYLHGLAGDLAAAKMGQEALTSSDIVRFLPRAFLQFEHDFR